MNATAPLVTDAQLGGNGVLRPGKQSERFQFEVTFKKGKPFTFLVNTSAVAGGKAGCTDPVTIPDANLAAAIRDKLGKPASAVTCADLESLTEFFPRKRSIVNLEGIQFAANLISFDVSFNDITDLRPLQGLPNLKELFVGSNNISDLTPLRELTSLTLLELSGNRNLSDLTPLQGLTNLTDLRISSASVSNPIPLQNLANLDYLYGNEISNLIPLQSLTNLTELFLYDNHIKNLTPLQSLTNIERFGLIGNKISDIGALVDNRGLNTGDEVYLGQNPLSAQALEDVKTLRARGVKVFLE